MTGGHCQSHESLPLKDSRLRSAVEAMSEPVRPEVDESHRLQASTLKLMPAKVVI
jgi:hypothetical protein